MQQSEENLLRAGGTHNPRKQQHGSQQAGLGQAVVEHVPAGPTMTLEAAFRSSKAQNKENHLLRYALLSRSSRSRPSLELQAASGAIRKRVSATNQADMPAWRGQHSRCPGISAWADQVMSTKSPLFCYPRVGCTSDALQQPALAGT